MSAYFIVRADVRDWEGFQAYVDRSPGVLARFGGRHIARGGRTVTFEGPEETRRIVIAQFPDFESAEACYRSAEYQAIIPLREGNAVFEFILTDGLDGV